MKLKTELYKEQQEEICDNIIDILDLDEGSITLYELDNNKEKQENIINLIPNIKKYFTTSHIIGVKNPKKTKRPCLSIIKHILKSKYKILNTDTVIIKEDKKIRTIKYTIIKKGLLKNTVKF